MKLPVSLLFLFVFTLNVNAQNYVIEQKEIIHESKSPKWELSVKYPQIKNSGLESEVIFNLLAKQRAIAEKDSFALLMNSIGTDENNKENRGLYYTGDTVCFYDNKIISVNYLTYSELPGSAHPNDWTTCLNYDLEKNKEIKLTDLFGSGYIKTISGYCMNAISKQMKEKDSTWVREVAGPSERNFEVFNFTTEGFLISFSFYHYTVLIPYDYLREFAIKGSQFERFLK